MSRHDRAPRHGRWPRPDAHAGHAGARPPARPPVPGAEARGLALAALARVESGAWANPVLASLLDRSGLDRRDRALVTDLVYGATRMRRALDFLIAPHLRRDLDSLDPEVRAALRLGAYQLAVLDVPAHAAVAATVEAAPARARGLVNAVLRRVAAAPPPDWPDDATRLSYPDWIVERLTADLGRPDALAALERMNLPGQAAERPDGYVQGEASRQVAALVGAGPGERVGDLCAGPGGKATALAGAGAWVVAGDRHEGRARTVAGLAAGLGAAGLGAAGLGAAGRVAVMVADGTAPPLRPGCLDRVLVDAPCSGLGVLHRRPDARWRVRPGDVEALAGLQRRLLAGALGALAPGGTMVYAVCTLTAAETTGVDAWLASALPGLVPLEPPGPPWRPAGRGALLLPQAAGTDGMFVLRLCRE